MMNFAARMQAVASLLIMLIALFLNITYKPFIYHQHDTLETFSLLTSALTLLSGLVTTLGNAYVIRRRRPNSLWI